MDQLIYASLSNTHYWYEVGMLKAPALYYRTTKGHKIMAEWIAADKARAGLRHAVVCPNVTGKTKKRIAQSKRACAGSLAIVDKPQVA